MNRLAARLVGSGPLLWVAADQYAARLFGGGERCWDDAAALADWQRRAQSLLRSDVIALPLAELVKARLDHAPALLAAMAAKPRPAFALRTLLADAGVRGHVIASVAAVAATVDAPLVLRVPDPGAWLAAAYLRAHGVAVDVDDELADDAATYVADLLRSLTGLDALLVGCAPVPAPIANVARQFGWSVGSAAGPNFAVAVAEVPGVPTFVETDTGAPQLRYHVVGPHDAPEAVLARLASLRA